MTTHNQSFNFLSVGKVGHMLFTRQAPVRNAQTHSSLIAGLAGQFTAWRERRAAAAELAGLSDRELADIGVTRQQIPEIIQGKW